jgi:hypothetical protein
VFLAERGGFSLPWREPVERLWMSSDIHQPGPFTPHRAYFTHIARVPALQGARAGAKPEERDARPQTPLRLGAARERVSIRAVSEYLRHHDPGFTLRPYAT